MQKGLFFVAAILLVVETAALPKLIKIGGLFDTEDNEQELAFRLAVDFFNSNREQKPKPKIVAQVERIEKGDAFAATKKVCGLLEKGVAAIFGPQDPMTSLHVGSICDEVEVPHVETRWEHKPKRDALSINLYPSPAVLSRNYVAMIDYMGWKNFTLMYEEHEGIIRLQNFLKEANKNEWRVHIFKFNKDIPYRKVFWELKKEHIKMKEPNLKIVLDVSRQSLFEVLKQAQQVGMITEKQQYFITCLDFHTLDLDDFKYSKANFTGLRLVQVYSAEHQQLIEAMASPPYEYHRALEHGIRTETALMFDAVRKFILALQELDVGKQVQKFPSISCDSRLAKGSDGTSLINYMKSSNMMGTTGLVTFNGLGLRSVFQLDITFLEEEGLIKLGEILPGPVINITTNVSIQPLFEHKKFIITTKVSPPYTMLKNSSKDLQGNDRYAGFCIDFIEELAKHLDFSYEIRLVADGNFGEKEKQGTRWDGMIGEVMRGEADMAVASLSINSKREKVVDFTLPFMNTGIGILFKKPTVKVTSLFSFLSPFSPEVWIYLMGAVFAVSFVMFLVGRLTPYEWINPHPCRQDDIVVENTFNIRNTFWFNIGGLMQQGSDLVPTAFSTRTIASYWNFFTLIMVSSYTANLAAFLTVERVIYPFSNVEELVKQKKIKYGCYHKGSTARFFKDSNIDIYQQVWKAISSDPDNLVPDDEAGKEKVKKGNYAYFMESSTIEYITERECSLIQIGGLLDSKGYGIAIQKDSDKTSWISSGILHLQETGVIHTLKERWWKTKGGGRCVDKSKQSSSVVQSLTLANVGGVFVVLIFGMGVSVLVAILEFRWKLFFWENPNKETFWQRMKKELIFALSFDITTKPVPQLRKSVSTTPENSRSSEHSSGS